MSIRLRIVSRDGALSRIRLILRRLTSQRAFGSFSFAACMARPLTAGLIFRVQHGETYFWERTFVARWLTRNAERFPLSSVKDQPPVATSPSGLSGSFNRRSRTEGSIANTASRPVWHRKLHYKFKQSCPRIVDMKVDKKHARQHFGTRTPKHLLFA